jgi:hypothetical protein
MRKRQRKERREKRAQKKKKRGRFAWLFSQTTQTFQLYELGPKERLLDLIRENPGTLATTDAWEQEIKMGKLKGSGGRTRKAGFTIEPRGKNPPPRSGTEFTLTHSMTESTEPNKSPRQKRMTLWSKLLLPVLKATGQGLVTREKEVVNAGLFWEVYHDLKATQVKIGGGPNDDHEARTETPDLEISP